jgi:protein-L-isoaspartate(D-aspartate) O-methyltransferase
MLLDTFKHKGMRKQMIDKLKEAGISNEDVLRVMSEVPRHWFLESAFLDFAYDDKPFPNRAYFGILSSLEVAKILNVLNIQPYQKILEIGVGTGYNTLLMHTSKGNVYALENDQLCFENAVKLFKELNKKIKLLFTRDIYNGLEEKGPYDHIVLLNALDLEPTNLRAQMAIGGKMIFHLKEEKEIKLMLIQRLGEDEYSSNEIE